MPITRKHIILFGLLTFCSCFTLWGQNYGNEWINYNQQYFVFKVAEEGVYRINKSTLDNAGFPTSTIDPRNIQIFSNSVQIPIHIQGENDGVFNSSDYIEFYAQKNEGGIDEEMYPSAGEHTNPYYSLYNDTLMYFITWNNSLVNTRFQVENDINTAAYTPDNYYIHESRAVFNDKYYFGEKDQFGSTSNRITAGEGWFATHFGKGGSHTSNLATPNAFIGGPDAYLETGSASNSNAATTTPGLPNHHLQIEVNGNLLHDISFNGYQYNRFETTFSPSILNNTTPVVHRSVDDLGVATDYQAVAFARIRYAHTFDLANAAQQHLWLPHKASEAKHYLQISNFNASSIVAYVLGNEAQKITVLGNNGSFEMLVPNRSTNGSTQLYISSTAQIKSVSSIAKVNGTGNFVNYANLERDSAFLMISPKPLMAVANQYKLYRETTGHRPVLIGVEDVYMQFGGVNKHAHTIKRFLKYVYNEWAHPPKNLLLVGKGVREVTESNSGLNPGARKSDDSFAKNLMPSYGYPSSDILYAVELDNTNPQFKPVFGVGRIAAKSPAEVTLYLNKVIEHENNVNLPQTIEDRRWMKNVLHFGGGGNNAEQQIFRNYLNNYTNIIQDVNFGGNVHSFFKTSSDPIDPISTSELQALLREGSSLMTFIGHATATGFDASVDAPSTWGNQGRYPLLIGISCYTGDMFQPNFESTAESFVLTPDAGVIGFISSVKLGIASYLNRYTERYYREMSMNNYGGTIGEHMLSAIELSMGTVSGSLVAEMERTCLNMNLHGDPALIMNAHPLPDLAINDASVEINPQVVTLSDNTFDIKVKVTNIGQATDSAFNVIAERFITQSNTVERDTQILYGLHFEDTVNFTFVTNHQNAYGVNEISVRVDLPTDVIDEIEDLNNNQISGIPYNIQGDGIRPVWPYEFAVIPDYTNMVLKASTINPLAAQQDWVMELDTTELYNSPFKQSVTINSAGGMIEWPVNLLSADSTVYFWRTRPGNNPTNWYESSFQFITKKTGWGQARWHQFEQDAHSLISRNQTTQVLEFVTDTVRLSAQVQGAPGALLEYSKVNYKIDGAVQSNDGCGTAPALHVAILDPNSAEPWGTYGYAPGTTDFINDNRQYGNLNNGLSCGVNSDKKFIFRQNIPSQMDAFADMLLNQVPDGHYILVYSWMFATYDTWNDGAQDISQVFQNLGATVVGQVGAQDSVPFVFFVQKGNPASVSEVVGSFITEEINFATLIPLSSISGQISSTLIGPASNWQSAHWRHHPSDANVGDTMRLQVFGVRPTGVEQLLTTYDFNVNDEIDLSSIVDVNQYPYLRLKALLKDSSNSSAPQLYRWHVLYDYEPELALVPNEMFYFTGDNADQGSGLSLACGIRNISDKDMDSLLVAYRITDQYNNSFSISYPRQDSLKVNEVLYDTIHISSSPFTGVNYLWMEANPILTPLYGFDQPERYHFNNILQIPLTINVDDENPLLDVSFDGVHILNGEIVAPNAEVNILLDDNNPYLLLDDTTHISIFLIHPDGVQERLPYMSNDISKQVNFYPATDASNRARVQFNLDIKQDGKYDLIVQAQDKSGNTSSKLDYKVSFEIVMKSSITKVVNYPNPFSTCTQFVFTLTGSEIPDDMFIQIMTISGKVVKEIYMDELGGVRIGHNRSAYCWDGRDNFGDLLANGVYLYRVISKINGEEIEERATNADQFFKEGWGKMVILR